MKIFGATFKGPTILETVSTLTSASSADESRIVYTEDTQKIYYCDGAEWKEVGSGSNVGSFGCSIDGAGIVISPGVKQVIIIPFPCTITGWNIVGSPLGTVVLDVWKKAGEVPTVVDTITGTEKPSLTSAAVNSGTVVSWITSVSAGDVIVFNVDSCLQSQKLTLAITVLK